VRSKTDFCYCQSRGFVYVWHAVWWKDKSVICNCCWHSQGYSFLHPCSTRLILPSQIQDSPNHEGQVPLLFTSPRDRVVQLYPQALSPLFIASNNSQDDGGRIWSHLHMGIIKLLYSPSLYSFGMVCIENIDLNSCALNSCSIVACISVTTDTCISAVT
jgi:hypothetical protein